MAGEIQFDSDPQFSRFGGGSHKPSALSALVMRLGLASDEANAQRVLMVAIVASVLATIFVQYAFGTSGLHHPPPMTSGMIVPH